MTPKPKPLGAAAAGGFAAGAAGGGDFRAAAAAPGPVSAARAATTVTIAAPLFIELFLAISPSLSLSAFLRVNRSAWVDSVSVRPHVRPPSG
jgi:hypothetical protein